MLKEEQANINSSTVEHVIKEWEKKPISVTITGSYLYKMYHKSKGWLTLFALNAYSDDVLEMREDLGLQRKPYKYNMHVTLFEKKMSYY